MSLPRLLAQRVALGVVAAWTVLTIIFGVFMGTDDWNLSGQLAAEARQGGLSDAQRERIQSEYLGARDLDRSTSELYVDWITNMFTLQWSESFETSEPVLSMITDATTTTAAYVIPGIVIAMVIGSAIGIVAALYRDSWRDRFGRTAAYLGLGIPNFWIGAMLLVVSGTVGFTFDWRAEFIPPVELPLLYSVVVPALLVGAALTAAVASYARSYALQYVATDFTKFVRAKGGGTRDVARHVLRNGAIPLVSLAFTETLALLAISVFVIEAVFGIPGLGLIVYNAIWAHDLPVLLGATMVIVTVGVIGNIIQDLAYSALDPRVDTGTR